MSWSRLPATSSSSSSVNCPHFSFTFPWNCFQFQQQAYVSLEPRHLERKCAALKRYESQQHRNYANEEYIRNVARTHGIVSGRDMAEVFEVYRWIL